MVFLKETWIVSLNGIHCNQNKTLKELPLKIDFPKIEIEKINRMMSSLNFELYTRNTGFFFEEVCCSESELIFKLSIAKNVSYSIVIYFHSVNTETSSLSQLTLNTGLLIIKVSNMNKGIIISCGDVSYTPYEIGFLIKKNDLKNESIILDFYNSLIKIIKKYQDN